jgi:hypothetical protein
LEISENFTCGEAIGRHHNQTGVIHYAPDDWIDEVFWMECRFRRKWPEGYRDGFDIKLKELEDQKFTKAKIRVLERIIRKKEEKDGTR